MTTGFLRTAQYLITVLFGQVLSFLLLPIVTRYLDPTAYGQYALALAASGLVGMVSSSWVRNVGLRLYYEAGKRHGTRAFYLGTTLLQAALAIGLYLVMLAGMWTFGLLSLGPGIMLLAGLTLILGDQYTYAITLLRAEERSTAFAVAEISSGLLRFGATIVALWSGLVYAETLFVAMALAYALGAAFAIPALWKRLTGPSVIDLVGVRETLRHGPAALPSSLSHWLDSLANRLILQAAAGTATVGVFTVGFSIGERLIGSLTQAVFMMAWPSVLNAWRSGGNSAAKEALASAQAIFMFLTVGPVLFMMLFSAQITRLLAGPQFHAAAELVPLVGTAMWLQGVSTYLNRHLELQKRYGLLSAVALSGAVINVLLSLSLVNEFGMLGVASASVMSSSLTCGFYYLIRDTSVTRVNYGAFMAAGALAAGSWIAARAGSGVLSLTDSGGLAEMAIFIAFYVLGLVVIVLLRQHSSKKLGEKSASASLGDSDTSPLKPSVPDSPSADGEHES